jgi:predicted permease
VLSQPLGFEMAEVVTMRIAAPEVRYPTRDVTLSFFTQLLDDIRAQPVVRAAGVASTLPLGGNTGSTLTIQGREQIPVAMRPTVGWQWASPGFFNAMGMPILRGRDFSPDDRASNQHVTIINETLARLHFVSEDPIGKRVYFGAVGPKGPSEWHEVIGVVGDVRHRRIDAAPDPRAYDLFGQHWGRTVSLAIRTSESPLHVAGLVRRLLAERDRRLAVFAIRTTADLVSDAVAMRRLLLWIVSGFAVAGLTIALIGLYGTLSYIVAQRTREVGVRVALGATRGEIRRLVVHSGLRMVAMGLLLGVMATSALWQVVDAQLFGLTYLNTAALAAAAVVLMAAALIACLAPAAHAVRINPVDALRE